MRSLARVAVLLLLVDVAAAQRAERDRIRTDAAPEIGPASKQELFRRRRELLAPGTNVYLEDMVVRAKSGAMLRVAYGKHDIFVAPIDPSSLDFIAIGARIDIRGSLRETLHPRQARLAFGMSAREARRLARQRVYVDAWSVMTRE